MKTCRIWFSYDGGYYWYDGDISANNCIDITSLESTTDLITVAISYKEHKRSYRLFIFNFSKAINRRCQDDDYETWYVPRDNGNCYQGHEMSYLKKKSSALCFDNKTFIVPTITPCPCSLEDFLWYYNAHHSKPNYQNTNRFCEWDMDSNYTEPVKICRDGGIPLTEFNGYDVTIYRFAKLDSDLCYPQPLDIDKMSKYSDYCISENFSVQMFVFFPNKFYEARLDYQGHYLPASYFKGFSLPLTISHYSPITYDISSRAIYFYQNGMIHRVTEQNSTFYSEKTSLYNLKFKVISMAFDQSNSLLFILDTNYRLFVIFTTNNYIKLLSINVTSFRYHPDTL
ncbi:Vacuolar protein sorting/targeting protein 10 [Thelohanellus kitauei]|uniref:Vacuolar protein sorting/targeting protein 10 n=1 Tax=Thelohanellus kitauei TaxID=669202 RepID=A0A0C2M635_THEKT|nr:Vacuolar protein sorting/targeting protein 10 [Thelohanellus kitauei]